MNATPCVVRRTLRAALLLIATAMAMPACAQGPALRRQTERWASLLYSDDLQQRATAAAALLSSEDPAALDALRKALQPESPEATRITVIRAFELHGKDTAADLIIAALDDRSEEVRQAAVSALTAIRSPLVTSELRKTAENRDASIARRTQAIAILGEMREWEAVPTLIGLLGDPNQTVSASARAALKLVTLLDFESRLEWLDWWEIYRKKTRVQALEERARRQDEQIKKLNQTLERLYLRLLREHETDEDPGLLVDALAEGGSDRVKLYAIQRLSVFQSPKPETKSLITEALTKALRDPSAAVRRRAAESLGARKEPDAVPGLVASLNDPIPFVREAAARALGQLRSADAVPSLCAMLSDTSPEVAAAAAWALGVIGDARAIGPLVAIINSAEPDGASPAYEAAAEAIANFAVPDVLPVLIEKLIASKNAKVRYAGVRALGRFRAPEVVAPLGRLAREDPQPEIRVAAVTALAETGQDTAVAEIESALGDQDKTVSEHAFRSLMELANARPNRFAVALDLMMREKRFDLAEMTLERASDQLRALPEYPREMARLRFALARGFMAAEQWEKAKPHLDRLVSEDTKNANYIKALCECLRRLGRYDALGELLFLARRDLPEERAYWWRASLDLAEAIFASGEWSGVVNYVNELEKEDATLGGPETAARLRELRKEAAARLAGARDATGGR